MLDAASWELHSVSDKKYKNKTSQLPTKRPRKDPEETTPTIIVNQASATTTTEESVNRNLNLLTASPLTIHNKNVLALKLNHLKEKSIRYISDKDVISQCIKSKLVPKRLELTLEPKIKNYDQDLIDSWYSNLNLGRYGENCFIL